MPYSTESGRTPEEFNPATISQEETTEIIGGMQEKLKAGATFPDDFSDQEVAIWNALNERLDTLAELGGLSREDILDTLKDTGPQGGENFLNRLRQWFASRN